MMFPNNEWVTEEIKREIKKIPRNKWKWKHNSKPMGCIKSSSTREVYSNTTLPHQKVGKKNIDLTPKTTGKRIT